MALDFSAIFDMIQELAVSDRSVGKRMREVIDYCQHEFPHDDWPRLSSLDYDKDILQLTHWIPGVFNRQPAPFQIQGLWIGLCNPYVGGNVSADMYVGSLGQYSPEDEELGWLWGDERHYPDDAYARSSSLPSIHEISYARDSGLRKDAEWPLCLAFGVFAVHSLMQGQTPRLVGSDAPQIGVVVGFDGGDMLKVGELNRARICNSCLKSILYSRAF